jgi:hypothetical protein
MSFNALDVIDRLPFELQARLESDPFFADIPVVVADKGNVKAELERMQAAITEKSGRRGIAVIVLQVVGDDDYPNVTFGPLKLRPAFQVIEHTEWNNDERGTKKSARRVCRRIHQIVKPLALYGIVTQFQADQPAIEPVNLTEVSELLVGMQVNFITHEFDVEQLSQVATPGFSPGGGQTVAMSCVTPDAAIWYSSDDSFPAPGRPGSTLYTVPVAIPEAGFTLRAAAYKAETGWIASEVIRATIEVEFGSP